MTSYTYVEILIVSVPRADAFSSPLCSSPFVTEKSCPENQMYTECGTACPITCENKDNPPFICPLVCMSGCFCIQGYYKDANGNCVTEDGCNSSQGICTCLGWVEICYKLMFVGHSCVGRTRALECIIKLYQIELHIV